MELVGLVIILVLALTIILFFTRGVFARDLTSALKRVTQQEQELQAKADILEQRISQMEREYQAKVKRGEAEAEHILEEAKREAMNIRTAAIEEAKYRARQLMVEAEQRKAQLKTDVAKDLNGKAVQRACDALRFRLPASALATLQEMLVNELLAALPQVGQTTSAQDIQRIDVITAQPFSPSMTAQLTRWVAEFLGPQAPLQVETDPRLVAGAIVQIGSTVVDNSLANQLGQRSVNA